LLPNLAGWSPFSLGGGSSAGVRDEGIPSVMSKGESTNASSTAHHPARGTFEIVTMRAMLERHRQEAERSVDKAACWLRASPRRALGAALRWTLSLAVLSMLVAACAPQEYQADTPAQYQSAAGCAQVNRDNLYAAAGYSNAYLTVATGEPAFPPWWEGGTTDEHPEWTLNDPYLGRGFEGAVTFEVAERLGFAEDRIRFVPIGFTESFAPGPKGFDFVLQQISFLPERAESVDFSEGYYDVHQVLVSVRGSPIAGATTLEDLKDATLGAPIETTSLNFIEDTIQPTTQPAVYDGLSAAVDDLKNGRVDGIVVDLPSASFITAAQVPEGVVVGRLTTVGPQEYLAMAFEKGSPLVECVNLALQEMKDDGSLDAIRQKWLADTADAPLIRD
jgi:polar amino acid transport system substrate-binding protein